MSASATEAKAMPPRVRIAPSPTGFFHIGTARTALFNWLFAKQRGGVFIVRIEDTDRERSTKEYEENILAGLRWLGLNWDEGPQDANMRGLDADFAEYSKQQRLLTRRENLRSSASHLRPSVYGPYRQSERGHIYKRYLEKLLSERHAYYCFCTEAELEAMRQNMIEQGQAPRYNGHCRSLTEAEVAAKHAEEVPSVIRFKVPLETVHVNDMIRGKVSFDAALSGDIVIAKNLTEPLYNLAVVIDDYEMHISHVIRGEEHLANTPKQIALQKALQLPPVAYAHLPLILNADRSKMSKRFAATSVDEYRKAGYLSTALLNFLALLGWHPSGAVGSSEQEIFTPEELITTFDLARVQKGGAVFNEEKLNWINREHLKRLSDAKLYDLLKHQGFLQEGVPQKTMLRVITLVRDRMTKLSDFPELARFCFVVDAYPSELLVWKATPREVTTENLKAVRELVAALPAADFKKEKLAEAFIPLTNARGRGEALWPLRVALSGREVSPGPFEIMEVIGKREALVRIDQALARFAGLAL